jgi:ATP synthase F1 gamma subunit
MKRSNAIAEEMQQIETVDMLAETFKGISSHHISRLKSQVLQSKEFFAELWTIYTQLRENPRQQSQRNISKPGKTVDVIVTAEGGLSGDIDRKLVDWMLEKYDAETHDIIVLGHHGVLQLAQAGVEIKKYYKVPDQDVTRIDPGRIIDDVLEYENAMVFYQTYVTLGVQDIKSIDLFESVHQLGQETGTTSERITFANYIFEPGFWKVVSYMESIMMGVALSQAILESKLAQYASRFNAMSAAHEKAQDITGDLRLSYRRAQRAESDERTREIINGMRHGR